MILDLLEKLYFHELEVREKIIVRVQLVMTLHVSLIAVVMVMLKGISRDMDWKILAIYFLIIIVGIIFIGRSIVFLYRVLTGYKYCQLPDSSDLIKYEAELENYADTLKDNNANDYSVTKEFKKTLIKKYSRCADENKKINERRRRLLTASYNGLWFGSLFVLLSGGYYILFGLDSKASIAQTYNHHNSICVYHHPLVIIKRKTDMPEEENQTSDNNEQKPSKTVPPKEPDVTYSTEDYKPDTDGKEKLNE